MRKPKSYKRVGKSINFLNIMKLSLDALKERAESVAPTELLNSISGGVANACHPVIIVGPLKPVGVG